MNFFERQEYIKNLTSGVPKKKVEPLSFDPEESLTVTDLQSDYKYSQPIRDYMVERMGQDYRGKTDEEVVDDFVKHMRYFNANTVSTAGEVRFVTKANDRQKETARKAYQISLETVAQPAEVRAVLRKSKCTRLPARGNNAATFSSVTFSN